MIKPFLFLFFSFLSISTYARCFVVALGGAVNYEYQEARIKYVMDTAKEMNCETIEISQLPSQETFNKLHKFIKDNKFDSVKDKIHLSFLDHGSSGGIPLYSGYSISYGAFMESLDGILPSGSRVTYSSHICWPEFHEALLDSKLKNIATMCGGSSTRKDSLSLSYDAVSTLNPNFYKQYVNAGFVGWKAIYNINKAKNAMKDISFGLIGKNQKKKSMLNFHQTALEYDWQNVTAATLTSHILVEQKLSTINEYNQHRKDVVNFIARGNLEVHSTELEVSKQILNGDCEDCVYNYQYGLNYLIKLKNDLLQIVDSQKQKQLKITAEKHSPQLLQFYNEVYLPSHEYIKNYSLQFKNEIEQFVKDEIEYEKNYKKLQKEGNWEKLRDLYVKYHAFKRDGFFNKNIKLFSSIMNITQMENYDLFLKKFPQDSVQLKKILECEQADVL